MACAWLPTCDRLVVGYRPRNRAELIEQTLRDLKSVGVLREDARPMVAEVVTLDPAYIIYDLRHGENTAAIKEYLRGLDVVTKGRFGEWEYLNMDHSILSGKAAAEGCIG